MSPTRRFQCEPAPPELIGAVFTAATNVLVLAFDRAMNTGSLPGSSGTTIQLNAAGVNRHGRNPVSWLDATHLSVATGTTGAVPVTLNTTRCLDTTGIVAADGDACQVWDEFPLTIV